MNELKHIEISKIKRNPDNPNPHSTEKTETLAANIEEFGLLNPITLKKNGNGYEIIAGEGRFEAFRKLGRNKIPSLVVRDTSDYLDWGRRFSENEIRSFNWVAGCIELANMKAEGKTSKELQKIFGISQRVLDNKIATGECIKHINIKELENNTVESTIFFSSLVNSLF